MQQNETAAPFYPTALFSPVSPVLIIFMIFPLFTFLLSPFSLISHRSSIIYFFFFSFSSYLILLRSLHVTSHLFSSPLIFIISSDFIFFSFLLLIWSLPFFSAVLFNPFLPVNPPFPVIVACFAAGF